MDPNDYYTRMSNQAYGTGGLPNVFLSGWQPQLRPDFDFGQLGASPQATMLLNTIMTPIAQQMGIRPFQLFPTQNIADQMRTKTYWHGQQETMARSAQADATAMTDFMFGAAGMMGIHPSDETRRMIQSNVDAMAPQLMPIMAMMAPQALEAMGGVRGSQTLMSQALFRAGRTMVDPATGQIGLSPKAASAMVDNLYKDLYGPNADISKLRGFGAGAVGQLIEQMQGYGMLGVGNEIMSRDKRFWSGTDATSQSTIEGLIRQTQRERPDECRSLIQKSGLTGLADNEAIKQLSTGQAGREDVANLVEKMAPAAFASAMQVKPSEQIRRKVEEMTGVVASLRDVFGDMGMANAPIPVLIQKLNELTQGGLSTMSATDLEHSVRKMHAIATQTGMGMETFTNVNLPMGLAAARRHGLDDRMAPDLAMAGALAGAAFNATGGNRYQAWNGLNSAEVNALSIETKAAGLASRSGQLISTAMRLADTQDVGSDTPLGRYAAAVRAKKQTFAPVAGGPERSLAITNDSDLEAMAQQSGIRPGVASNMSLQRDTNSEFGKKYDAGDIAQREQIVELSNNVMNNAAAVAARDALPHLDPKLRNAAMARASAGFGTALREAFETDEGKKALSEPTTRGLMVGRILSRTAGVAMSEAEMKQAGETLVGQLDMGIRANRPDLKGIYGALQLYSKAGYEARDKLESQAASQEALASALSGVGQVGAFARMTDLIRDNPNNWREVLTKTLNVASVDELTKRLSAVKPADANVREAAAMQIAAMGGLKEALDRPEQLGKTDAERNAERQRILNQIKAINTGKDVEIAEKDLRANAEGRELTDREKFTLAALNVAKGGGMIKRLDDSGIGGLTSVSVKDFDKLLAGLGQAGKGDMTPDAARELAANADKIYAAFAYDPKNMARLGPKGAETVRAFGSASTRFLNSFEFDVSSSNSPEAVARRKEGAEWMRTHTKEFKDSVAAAGAPVSAEDRKKAEEEVAKNKRGDVDKNMATVEHVASEFGVKLDKDDIEELTKQFDKGELGRRQRETMAARRGNMTNPAGGPKFTSELEATREKSGDTRSAGERAEQFKRIFKDALEWDSPRPVKKSADGSASAGGPGGSGGPQQLTGTITLKGLPGGDREGEARFSIAGSVPTETAANTA